MMRKVVAERFDKHEIFLRDGYRCQHCKKRTRPDRDVNHPLYPNLDHIIALADGGPHTRANVQCLCRSCNIIKSDKALSGQQLRLLG